MREIKFRAWDKQNKRMIEWDNLGCIALDDCLRGKSINYELMQFTGLKDKNRIDIYEGDIVIMHDLLLNPDNNPEIEKIIKEIGIEDDDIKLEGEILKIEFIAGMFMLRNKKWSFNIGRFSRLQIEIVGNIYENPELIK
jgi:uncharacterized phage protein (TIGR01671 family)